MDHEWTIFRYSGLYFYLLEEMNGHMNHFTCSVLYFYLLEEMNGHIDHFQVLCYVFLTFGTDEWTYRPFSGILVDIFICWR